MQASELWSGHDYAWARFGKRRGIAPEHHNCTKVTILKVFKDKASYAGRSTTYAKARLENGSEHVIRAYDIVSFWEDYEEARASYKQRQEEAAAKQKEMLAEREAKRDRRVALEKQILGYIEEAARTRGLSPKAIRVSTYGDETVTFQLSELEAWTGLDGDPIYNKMRREYRNGSV